MRLVVATLVLLLAPSTAVAAGAEGLTIGALQTRSRLGEPFNASCTIQVKKSSALGDLELAVADAAAYAERGLERDPAVDQLRVRIIAVQGRIATVQVNSAAPLREPSFTLLLEARAGGARAVQEFTVLLDPPESATASAPGGGLVSGGGSAGGGAEFSWELDAYYSSVALEVPLTDEPVPNGGSMSEWQVYKELFKDSLRPRLLLLEASVYPMPVLGTYIKEHSPNTYDDFTIGDGDLNLLEGLTAGFQEPWAVSAFVGSSMQFSRAGHKAKGSNKGYMGYLVSYGAKHIRQNVLIDDDWWEFEWKLKGERVFEDEDLTWSFRLGAKRHGHPDIADTIYLGGRRSNLDYKQSWLSWLANSSFEWLTELSQHDLSFLRQDLIIGKKFPLKEKRFALSLDVGVVYERSEKYTGALTDPTAEEVTLVFRPNITF